MPIETFLATLYREPRHEFDERASHAYAAESYALDRARESARRTEDARIAHELATVGE